MAFGDTLARFRREKGMTQGELASRLYVTRQAVSRWENNETMPGIDMAKLIAVVLDVPISHLLDMPEHPICQSCGMPLTDPTEIGTKADGSPETDFCIHCYKHGAYTYEATMDELIEGCAPFMVQHTGMSLDEAVSLMGAMLPGLKRWAVVQANESKYGAEARAKYGDSAVDETNRRLLEMDEKTWASKEELEAAIVEKLKIVLASRTPAVHNVPTAFDASDVRTALDTCSAPDTCTAPDTPDAAVDANTRNTHETPALAEDVDAMELAAMHAKWIRMHWGEPAFTPDAHVALAEGYLADERFVEYYDSRAGVGATAILVDAIIAYHLR